MRPSLGLHFLEHPRPLGCLVGWQNFGHEQQYSTMVSENKRRRGALLFVAFGFVLGTLTSRISLAGSYIFILQPANSSHQVRTPKYTIIDERETTTTSVKKTTPQEHTQSSGSGTIIQQTNFSGIVARPFVPWAHALPCFPPDEDWMWTAQNTKSDVGFLYIVSITGSDPHRVTKSLYILYFSHASPVKTLPLSNTETIQNRFEHMQWDRLAHGSKCGSAIPRR